MMTSSRLLVLGAIIGLAAAPVEAQTADELFNPEVIQELRLFMNSRDLLNLREHYLDDTYYPADMEWGTTRFRNVAVRSRGNASRNPTKLGLRLDFNRFRTGERFVGLTSAVLDNLWTDPSLMRERLALSFFERMGQPASRVSFVRLYINQTYQGLYTIVEPVDATYVLRTLGLTGGYLFEFKYRWARPYFGEYLGDELGPYKELFEPETHRLAADAILYSPIRDLFREANHPDDAQWRAMVNRYVDLEQLVTYLAIEMFLAERDGLTGYAGMANFFLFRPDGTNQHRLLTWDRDNAFERIELPIFERTELYEIVRRALVVPELRTRYLDMLEACARSAAQDGWLVREVTNVSALITAVAHDDGRKQFSNDEFDAAVAFLGDFARQRPAFVLKEVAKARSAVLP